MTWNIHGTKCGHIHLKPTDHMSHFQRLLEWCKTFGIKVMP